MMSNIDFTLANGIQIPAIGYGSFLATSGGREDVIATALEAGYRYIDTARFYNNEDEIGEVLKRSSIPRNELFLVSKVWPTMLGREKTLASFEASCKSLQTDYIDMFLIHWPKTSQDDPNWIEPCAEGWQVLEDLYRQGRVRAIGVCNFLPHHMRPLLERASIRPMIDQLELHVGYMQEHTLQYLHAEGILPQAWSPLGRGSLLHDERITAMAARYGKTNAQLLLRYLIQRGIPAIPKASTLERMTENRDVFDFVLSDDDMSFLSCLPQTGWSGEHPDLV